jgi:RNA polymerase sigma factor (sigma-70 family)
LGNGNGSATDSSPRNAVDLLAEFRLTGRQGAFEEIVRRYAAMVFGVCLKTTRNAHDAEDATQAVFLSLATHCKTNPQAIAYVGPWLQKVARRVSLDIRRSKKRRAAREETHAATNGNGNGNGHADGGQEGVDVEELKVVLNEELHQLPAKYRLPMILHYFGGLSREEMARELGCKPSTLGVRIHRGRQMLAQRLTERGASPGHLSLGLALTMAIRDSVSDGMIAATSRAATELMTGKQLGSMISAHVLAFSHGAAGMAMIAKLKTVAAMVLIALLTLAAAAGAVAKVVPLEELGQRWIELRGYFRLPRLQSPFHAPRADAGDGSDDATTVAEGPADAPFVRPVMWQSNEPSAPPERRLRPGGTPNRSRHGSTAPARFVAQLVSSVISPAAAPVRREVASASPPPAPAPRPAAEARSAPVRPAPAPARRVATPVASVRTEGDVAYGQDKPVFALMPPPRMFDSPAGARYPLGPTGPRTFVAPGTSLTVGGPAGSRGAVTLDRGVHRVDTQVFGEGGRGEINQLGGVNVASNVRLGVHPGSVGVYNLNENRLLIAPAATTLGTPAAGGIEIGHGGDGTLNIGDELGGGEIGELGSYGPLGGSLVLRGDDAGTGTLRGTGRIELRGFFNHNGRVIADGYGQDRTLEFTGFKYLGNSIDNPATGGDHGWFAQDHGKLVLPNLRVRKGTATYTWGEDQGDPTIDLVNSVRLTIHDAERDGLARISLLSKDRLDVPALPQGHTFIGVWQFEDGGLPHGAVDLLVRYDDALAAQLHLDENVLKLWRYHDGQWIRINDETFTRDTDLNLIGGRAEALEFFAVSAPEPATAGVLLVGAGALLLRRRPRVG